MSESLHYSPNDHLEFFGLNRNPFPVAPDNTDFYLSPHNESVIERLTQGILSRKGFMLLTGEIGLGKTTLSRRIIQQLSEHPVITALILHSFQQEEDLLRAIIHDFGGRIRKENNHFSGLMATLSRFLLKKNKAGINCVIIIDDAQNLTVKTLELIRMISNLEADREKLVQILLIGQPELVDKLNQHELRQLKSRITVSQQSIPLLKSEVPRYVQFKLNMAGNSGKIKLTKKAMEKLYQKSWGNFRRVNILMDQVLMQAAQDQTLVLQPDYITKADQELAFVSDTKPAKGISPLVFAFSIILVTIGLCAGMGFYLFNDTDKSKPSAQVVSKTILQPPPLPESTAAADQTLPVKTPSAIPPAPNTLPASPAMKTKQAGLLAKSDPRVPGSDIPPVAEAVADFLSAYHLGGYTQPFNQALYQGNFKSVNTAIYRKTGYQLISMSQLPDFVRDQYDVLVTKNAQDNLPGYLFFWKPPFVIDQFHHNYWGYEIRSLQELLSRRNRYHFNVDGIVGQRIIKSVQEFQQENGLPATGFPDAATLFLLVNYDKITSRRTAGN